MLLIQRCPISLTRITWCKVRKAKYPDKIWMQTCILHVRSCSKCKRTEWNGATMPLPCQRQISLTRTTQFLVKPWKRNSGDKIRIRRHVVPSPLCYEYTDTWQKDTQKRAERRAAFVKFHWFACASLKLAAAERIERRRGSSGFSFARRRQWIQRDTRDSVAQTITKNSSERFARERLVRRGIAVKAKRVFSDGGR